ncbi:hypothetical protein ACOME3_005028 [Neoechinorhynchus agilis]
MRRRSPLIRRSSSRRQRADPAEDSICLPRLIVTNDETYLNANSLRFRFPRIYLPSTFIRMNLSYKQMGKKTAVTLLTGPCRYHIMDRDLVDRPCSMVSGDIQEPKCLRHHVKVMLLEIPDVCQMHREVCDLCEHENGSGSSASGKIHQSHLIKYLLGYRRSKNAREDVVAIGGYWDPELDGADPANLGTLVNTAIRTCRYRSPSWGNIFQSGKRWVL